MDATPPSKKAKTTRAAAPPHKLREAAALADEVRTPEKPAKKLAPAAAAALVAHARRTDSALVSGVPRQIMGTLGGAVQRHVDRIAAGMDRGVDAPCSIFFDSVLVADLEADPTSLHRAIIGRIIAAGPGRLRDRE